jgi:hypothetical protein
MAAREYVAGPSDTPPFFVDVLDAVVDDVVVVGVDVTEAVAEARVLLGRYELVEFVNPVETAALERVTVLVRVEVDVWVEAARAKNGRVATVAIVDRSMVKVSSVRLTMI